MRGLPLPHVADNLVPIGFHIPSAADMQPVVLVVRGLEDELVEVGVVFDEVHPAFGLLQIGMPAVILPRGVGGEGQQEVGSFAQGVLRGVGATNLDVELVAAVAAGDDDGFAYEGT